MSVARGSTRTHTHTDTQALQTCAHQVDGLLKEATSQTKELHTGIGKLNKVRGTEREMERRRECECVFEGQLSLFTRFSPPKQ